MKSSVRVKAKLKWLLFRAIAIVVSTVVGLALCELTVRIVRSDLGDLVHDVFEKDVYRIFANPRNKSNWKHNPDTGEKELVLYNSLGLRQHREFDHTKSEGTVRVGVFGDSFTANLSIGSAYSFTEPLDYLLNQAGTGAEVLNFGTSGYGTDQSYLQYQSQAPDLDLDIVVYVFCQNDLPNNLANQLFTLDEEGELRYLPERKRSLFVAIARNFYLTYLLMQALQQDTQLAVGAAYQRYNDADHTKSYEILDELRAKGYNHFRDSPNGEQALLLFSEIMAKWAEETEARGQDFLVVFLPHKFSLRKLVCGVVADQRLEFLDLYPRALEEAPNVERLFFLTMTGIGTMRETNMRQCICLRNWPPGSTLRISPLNLSQEHLANTTQRLEWNR